MLSQGAVMPHRLPRRLLAGCIALWLPCAAAGSAGVQPVTEGPHNVVLIIADGMCANNELAASRYLYGVDKGLSFHNWPCHAYESTWDVTTYDRFAWLAAGSGAQRYDPARFDPLLGYDPAQGGSVPQEGRPSEQDVYFLTRLYAWGEDGSGSVKPRLPATDSAAAATALACGRKTDNGNLAWLPGDPADGALETIAEKLRRQRGGAIGVCSTVPFSHATPAAFVAHNPGRGNYHDIAREIIEQTRPEVVIGGGHPAYSLNSHGAVEDSYISSADYGLIRDDPDYVFVERRGHAAGGTALLNAADLAAAQDKKLFGLFGGAGGSLSDITVSDSPGAPQVTHGTADPTAAQLAQAALTVLSRDPDGFFLMVEQGDIDWCNHDNDFAAGIGCMWDLDRLAAAVVDWIEQPGDSVTLDNTLVVVLPDHTHYLRLPTALGRGELPQQVAVDVDRAEPWVHSWAYPGGEVLWRARDHTNELGDIYAIGGGTAHLESLAGSWYPGTRIIDNTQVYQAMAAWLGVE
jgi:alkaline phosphatase